MKHARKSREEVIAEMYEWEGIEDREDVFLELQLDDGAWEARHQGGTGEGDTRAEALEALADTLRAESASNE